MNYQQILRLTYVFNLVNQLINSPNSNPSNHIEIVKLENTFYIKDAKQNLYLISNEMRRNSNNIENILNTCIHFEKYKTKPIDGYIEYIKQLKLFHRNHLFDEQLLKNLQLQYTIDKSYFDN